MLSALPDSDSASTQDSPGEPLEQLFLRLIDSERAGESAHGAITREFARGRLAEGRQLAAFFTPRLGQRRVRVLDVGAGNGGVSAGLSENERFQVFALDVVPNLSLKTLRTRGGLPVHQIVAAGTRLPFGDASFDLILLLETIEHIDAPHLLGAELMRVLRTGGMCMITTPARLRHLFRPDPHYGVRALLALPDGVQRSLMLRRQVHYDVAHIYWSAAGVARHFPRRTRVEVLVNIPFPGIPRTPAQIAWYLLRRFLWDRIIVHK